MTPAPKPRPALRQKQAKTSPSHPPSLAQKVVRVDGTGGSMRGLYLREEADVTQPVEARVEVTAAVHEDADTALARVPLELKIDISATADWIECPPLLLAAHGTRSFEVRVNASKLPWGLHSAEIVGVERGAEWRGPVFRVPVTVTAPMQIASKAPFGNSVAQWARTIISALLPPLTPHRCGHHPQEQHAPR